jgi:hypothetical protein
MCALCVVVVDHAASSKHRERAPRDATSQVLVVGCHSLTAAGHVPLKLLQPFERAGDGKKTQHRATVYSIVERQRCLAQEKTKAGKGA